ncbi:MAG: hypothetical protein ACE15C_13125 [Phycisphaerae bacterium]
MTVTDLIGHSFGAADYGVAWAMFQLPDGSVRGDHFHVGDMPVRLGPLKGAKGPDDYAIIFDGKAAVDVRSNTAVGTIAGLLRLGEQLRAGATKDITQRLRFRTRNYKHEVRLDPHSPRSIIKYTDDTWEELCRRVVASQFNGIVLYAGYHPFEYLLEYNEYPDLIPHGAAERTAIRKAVSRGLAIAHRYGLKTFIQHYVSHFPPRLGEKLGLITGGRFSDVDHPEVDEYCRYCYREIFRQLEDLDGLYFNYESAQSNWEHVMRTAVQEFNRFKGPRERPIMVHRLWCFTDIEGMRLLIKAYKGRTILGHKISDTNDTYFLPVADSRVMDWKKALGKNIEWMFLVGPCHNCGTNLCDQLWGDYDFVHKMLADAQKKGADSISFHTVNEFFSPDVPDPRDAFAGHEKAMARFNMMHLAAAVDYVNGRSMKPAQRAAALAARVGVEAKAGTPLLKAVETSSQSVLLTFQQFCFGSSYEGFMNPGRYSFIQEPFYYQTATGHNNQATSLVWQAKMIRGSWIDKTIDVKVTPDNYLGYIIDHVDPKGKKATCNPQKVADLLGKSVDESLAALKKYRKAAGDEEADRLAPYIQQNALLGRYVRHEILAAVQLYSLYFAKARPAVVTAIKKGLAELKEAQAAVPERESQQFKILSRVALFWNGPDATPLITAGEELLKLAESTDFPFDAWRAYVESRRCYNEVRRYIRPHRCQNRKSIAWAAKCLKASIAAGRKALAALAGPKNETFSANVRAWLAFVENELARTAIPKATCTTTSPEAFLPLQHDDCFRSGENFIEDFIGFFRPFDYLRKADMSFGLWRTSTELVVAFRECGIDSAQRRGQWEGHKGGSDAFVERIHLDVEGKGRSDDMLIVWPMGKSVSYNRVPNAPVRTEFVCDATSWQTTAYIPFSLITRRKPAKGDVWGFNITGNPAILKNHNYTWAPQYDEDSGGNPVLFGKVTFA